MRDFLMQSMDAYRANKEFTEIPIGMFTWWSFGRSLSCFTFTHAQWEWPVAFLTGVIYNIWICLRKRMGSVILAHVVTNASLFSWVVLGSTPEQYFGSSSRSLGGRQLNNLACCRRLIGTKQSVRSRGTVTGRDLGFFVLLDRVKKHRLVGQVLTERWLEPTRFGRDGGSVLGAAPKPHRV